MLSPIWLQTFAAVVEHGGFTRAAERLDLTQAAVSQHVQRLEEHLGLLMVRRTRQIQLTPAGVALLDYWHELQLAQRRLEERLADKNERSGEVSLITPGSIGLALHPVLLALQKVNPGLAVKHRFAPDSDVLDAVVNKQYELGLLTLKPDDPRIAVRQFSSEPLELVAPAGVTVDSWHDLERLGFIDHPDGYAMATRLLARRFPGNPGIRNLAHHGFSNQISLILESVAHGLGFTVIPHHARRMFPRQEEIQVVDGVESVFDVLWLIHRAEWPLSARAAFVVEHLKQAIRDAEITPK